MAAGFFKNALISLVVVFMLLEIASCQLNRKNEAREQSRRKGNQKDREVSESSEGDVQTSSQCPEPNGYFADAEQCDKYYDCRDGQITEKLCPDGMVFNDYSPDQEKCDLPFNIDCSQRPKKQEPRPTQNCPRLHGYFAHKDASICDQFFYCVDGKFNMITCPAGLVFNNNTGICTWADEAKKKGCGTKDVFNFECPKVNETFAGTHPRFSDPDDCQYFYVCINGDIPRRSGCKMGQVFNDLTKTCDWPRRVPECIDWYKGQLTDAELEALENPPTTKKPKRTVPFVSRRKPMRPLRKSKGDEIPVDVE